MHQFVIWTSLEIEGFGVSLQHYNELIENDIKKEWNIPTTGSLLDKCHLENQQQNQMKNNFNH